IAELDANAAITDARNHSTELIGGVRLIDTANDAMMLTEKLVLNTLSKQVLTREHVKIFSPNSSTTADGLQGNLTDQRWQLMANVKSVIQP
ncbi:MAG: LPS export ABC transporter periplasmic protein LptC, partial [Pseudomonadales bacterium]|nr:LPS export ABC transporter periplasmic protein LptC [Pseudomonadales bacterium]